MVENFAFLISGMVFGLSSGIAPGPTMTLVISETLRHSKKEGIKIALAPLFTDAPIIIGTLTILTQLSNFETILGSISMLGAIFIGYLAYESISIKGVDIHIQTEKPQSLKKGIIANFFNPHPYVFWLTIGGPMLFKALELNFVLAGLFLLSFYFCIIGAKIAVVLIVDKSRSFLKSKLYIYTMRFLGILLLLFALIYIKDGLEFFGFI